MHEHAPRVGAAPCCGAKGGLGQLTRTAAIELAAYGITVNAVAPGEIATPMTGQEDTDPAETSRPGIPLGARDTPGRWPTSSPYSRPPPRPT